jgi:hypothetical protein
MREIEYHYGIKNSFKFSRTLALKRTVDSKIIKQVVIVVVYKLYVSGHYNNDVVTFTLAHFNR